MKSPNSHNACLYLGVLIGGGKLSQKSDEILGKPAGNWYPILGELQYS